MRRHCRWWTPEEDRVIFERGGALTCAQVGKLLGRTEDAVMSRALFLGVPMRRWVHKSTAPKPQHPWRHSKFSSKRSNNES
jgi:hypothetical protein